MIFVLDPDTENWSEELSHKYGWPVVSSKAVAEAFYLKKEKDSLCIDFNSLENIGFDFLKKYHNLSGSIFSKALGKNSKKILDATGGLLKDSHKMLLLGYQVTAVEVHPLIYELSNSAVKRAQPITAEFKNLNLVYGNSLEIKKTDADVIYIDPMFHHVNKSALPKKDMQLFREINSRVPVKPLAEETQFIDWALGLGVSRVVVKRPIKQPKDKKVSYSFMGKSIRYDLYT